MNSIVNAGEAFRTGDGLNIITSGNPSVPRWLGSPVFDIMVSAESENKKYAEQIRSSAGIVVFVSNDDDYDYNDDAVDEAGLGG